MSEPAHPPAAAEAALLRARARRLARRADDGAAARPALELLEFELGTGRYAIETRLIREVHPLRQLTELPGVPAFLRGIVNLRGRIVAVIDLRDFLGLPDRGLTDLHRVIVVGDDEAEIGLLAGLCLAVQRIDAAALRPAPALAGQALRGFTPQAAGILDVARILDDPRLRIAQAAEDG